MKTSLAVSLIDYGVGTIAFVGIFLLALHLAGRRTRKQQAEYFAKQEQKLENVAGVLERISKILKGNNEHGSRK